MLLEELLQCLDIEGMVAVHLLQFRVWTQRDEDRLPHCKCERKCACLCVFVREKVQQKAGPSLPVQAALPQPGGGGGEKIPGSPTTVMGEGWGRSPQQRLKKKLRPTKRQGAKPASCLKRSWRRRRRLPSGNCTCRKMSFSPKEKTGTRSALETEMGDSAQGTEMGAPPPPHARVGFCTLGSLSLELEKSFAEGR